jgi:hypothetical protein
MLGSSLGHQSKLEPKRLDITRESNLAQHHTWSTGEPIPPSQQRTRRRRGLPGNLELLTDVLHPRERDLPPLVMAPCIRVAYKDVVRDRVEGVPSRDQLSTVAAAGAVSSVGGCGPVSAAPVPPP